MSNYFDNQKAWSWSVDQKNGEVKVITEHSSPKPHTHTLDISKATVGEMQDFPDKIMGEAHRASEHEYKEEKEMSTFMERIRVDQATIDRINQVSKNHSEQSTNRQTVKSNEGGRERGDDGPGKTGRESGYKGGYSDASGNTGSKTAASGQSSAGQSSASTGGHSSGTGQSGGGHGSGTGSGGGGGHGGGTGSGGSGGHGGGSSGGGGHGGHGGH